MHAQLSQPLTSQRQVLCRLISTYEADQKQLELICTALDKVLATQHGTDLLLGAQQYAEAALASPQHRLRLLGVQQLGRLLLLRADQQQEAMQLETSLIKALQVGRTRWPAALTKQRSTGMHTCTFDTIKALPIIHLPHTPLTAPLNPRRPASPFLPSPTHTPIRPPRACCSLEHMPRASQDDTGIAGAAEKALLSYLHTQPPAAFADLLCGSSIAATQLAELSGSRSATQRMRAFALLVQAAAGSRSHAEQLKQAGGV